MFFSTLVFRNKMYKTYFNVFCTKKPATMPIVVGKEAAQTPSLFKVFSSIPDATTNGGAHANNGLRIQEFMIRPDRAKNFSEAMGICFLVIKNLSKLIKKKGYSTSVGDEGGFAPMITSNNQALNLILLAKNNSTNLSLIETKMVSNKDEFLGNLFIILITENLL